jgi:hypothetical protein
VGIGIGGERVLVKPHTNIRAAWRRSLAQTAAERTPLAGRFWDEFASGIVSAGGPPAGAIPAPDFGAGFWWCPFPPAYLVLVWFSDVNRFWGLWQGYSTVEVGEEV